MKYRLILFLMGLSISPLSVLYNPPLSAMPTAPIAGDEEEEEDELPAADPGEEAGFPAPAASPTPEGGEAAAPAAAGGDVKSEQFKWPTTIELDETKKTLNPTKNQKITELANEAEQASQKLETTIQNIYEIKKNLSQVFAETTNQLDSFLQEASYKKGKLEKTLTQLEKKLEQATQTAAAKK